VPLKDLVEKSVYIIREAAAQFKNPALLWSTGKDSTTMLSLIRESFYGEIPWPVIHIDTGKKFKEIYEFRDSLAKEWGIRLIIAKNEEALKIDMSPVNASRFECCTALKTMALQNVIRDRGFDAIIVSIRRDEHGIRSKERYMSPRDRDFRWRVYREKFDGDSGLEALQDAELSGWGIFESDFGPDTNHVRVHPLLHWTELDVWRYVKERNLPFNPLYRSDYVEKAYGVRERRYRSLGCRPCTTPIVSKASTIDEIVREIMLSNEEERAGRAQDKESMYIMEQLRALGYM
jgi:sulfate adenylyltransferase subunit 2